MNANYRIIKIGNKYFPQTRSQHVVTVGKGNIQPIHDWLYFKDSRGDDLWFHTYEDALKACVEADETEKIDEIFEIEINHGIVVGKKQIR